MLLKQSIAENMAKINVRMSKRQAENLIEIVERFLRHHGHEAAANDLHTEHMP